jgi:hypothetical protein
MSIYEQLFGYAIFAGAVAMVGAMVRDARRGWVKDEDGEVFRREDGPAIFLAHHLFQLASIVVLILTGFGVLGMLWK